MSSKHDNNVWHYGYERNIFRKVRLFFQRLKWSWQRMTKGYCDWDLWDLDAYYTDLFINSLNEFAEGTQGYPEGFADEEEWKALVRDMAKHFEESSVDSQEVVQTLHRVAELMQEPPTMQKNDNGTISVSFPPDPEVLQEAKDAYIQAVKDEAQSHEEHRNMGFELMKKWLPHLWW